MPFNGQGLFQRLYSWVIDESNNVFVDATRTDTDSNDIADGLSNCIARDGQSPWLNNLPAAGFKITGLGSGAQPGDSVNYGQVFNSPAFVTPTATTSPAQSDNSLRLATTAYVNQVAFSAALPAQPGTTTPNTLISVGGTASFREPGIKGADIASAATINLTTATGDFVHVTGTTTITAITIPVGAVRTVIFDGVLTLTNSASLLLPGGANITTAANDRMIVRGDTAGAVVVSYTRASGQSLTGVLEFITSVTVTSPVANIDFLTIFSSQYGKYIIEIEGLAGTAQATVEMRVAVGGGADSAANYYTRVGNDASTSSTATSANLANTVQTAASNGAANLTVMILNANATTKKTITSFGSYASVANPAAGVSGSVLYIGTSILSGFRLFMGSGNITTGTVRVYGVRNS